jgi:DNA-directed RNA polymerase subunit RPC12/RpoP
VKKKLWLGHNLRPFLFALDRSLRYKAIIPMTPTLWIVLTAAIAAVLLGGVFVLRSRRLVEEVVYHHNCPKCQRRFRFRAKQAGQGAECPRCRERFTFPAGQRK